MFVVSDNAGTFEENLSGEDIRVLPNKHCLEVVIIRGVYPKILNMTMNLVSDMTF